MCFGRGDLFILCPITLLRKQFLRMAMERAVCNRKKKIFWSFIKNSMIYLNNKGLVTTFSV